MKTKRILVISSILLIIAIIAIGLSALKYISSGETTSPQWLYIPSGATNEAIRDSLVSSLGQQTGSDVYDIWKFTKAKPSQAHGAYFISAKSTPLDIYRLISRGAQTPIKVTFNNIRTLDDLAARISSKMEFPTSQFLAACDSVLAEEGFTKAQYAAAFLPDSYEFYWTTSPQKFVKTLYSYYNKYWTEERREKASQLGLSPIEVSILASIVEEETNRSDERPIVARLYLNRLNRGMLLQADPTVKFAVGDFTIRRILNKHLSVNSPYNTYKYVGLPPGPIRIPDRRTLDAVLSAPNNNYIYMCASEDFSGRHRFTADYNEHLRNARRYQQALNNRNIK